jgi:hypothetical protein
MDSYDILVIGLSFLLALFLVLAIIVTFKVKKLVEKIQLITDKAQITAETVQDITAKINSAASLSTIGTAAAKIINLFKKEN